MSASPQRYLEATVSSLSSAAFSPIIPAISSQIAFLHSGLASARRL